MEKRAFKDQTYAAIAEIGKSFAAGNRLEIIDLLANGEKTVEQVARQTSISVPNASRHLQLLKKAHLAVSRREGNFIYYRLNGPLAYAVWQALRSLALAEEPAVQALLRDFRQEMDSPGSVSHDDLPDLQACCLLDVRPREEFEAGHLEGAVSVPLAELPSRLADLPRDKQIVAYCRGAFCTYADEAVKLLRSQGFNAIRLEEGVLDVIKY
jgi:DNA-binding transcriptional ArsR family regulator/rhodanese-related sulfurtransferase